MPQAMERLLASPKTTAVLPARSIILAFFLQGPRFGKTDTYRLNRISASEVDKLNISDGPAKKAGTKALKLLNRIRGEAAQGLRSCGGGVSVYSLIAVSRAAVPLMTDGGSIMTLSFYAAEKVVPNYNVMAVAKAGLESTVRYLAANLGSRNIRVNAISAGPIKTLAARGVGALGDMLKSHAERAPLRRNVDQLEVGGAALFLASPLSSAITGEILYVDCGYNIMGF